MPLNNKAFTMAEILVALVVLSVLAGLAFPAYFRTVEQSRSNEAVTNLNIIHMGEKIFRLGSAPTSYWGAGATTIGAANAALNVDMSATFFDTISITGAANNYTARLTRNNVSGGNGTDWFQYTFTFGNAAPVCTRTTGAC